MYSKCSKYSNVQCVTSIKTLLGLCFAITAFHAQGLFADTTMAPKTHEETHNQANHKSEANTKLNEQRYHYERAKIALKKKNTSQFDEHYGYLDDYPLRPYLDYSLVKQHLNPISLTPLDAFLNEYPDSYLSNRLRSQLVEQLAHRKRWEDFVYYYTPQIRSAKFNCYHLYALSQLGNTDILEEVSLLWSQGKSHPKACDPLFAWWKNKGAMSDDIIWTRFDAAMNKKQRRLARYVKSLLPHEWQSTASLYEKVDRKPSLITQHRKFQPSSKQLQQIIAFGIKKYARKHPKKALYHWERYEAQQLFDPTLALNTKHSIVKQLTRKGFTQEARNLIAQSPSLRQPDLIEKLIRDSLKSQRWDNVLYGINSLSNDRKETDRWQYWLARSSLELELPDAQKSAMNIFRKLAQKRSFYGFLSSDRLDTTYSFEHKPIEVPQLAADIIAQTPALIRSKELWLTGYMSEAQAEWRFGTKKMSSRELAAAGTLAQRWGWYNKSINAMIAGNLWDHLTVRFPLAFSDQVESVASETHVEKTLIYAIARQESAFLESAKSSAGAMGLMQLMPATARATAQKTGISHRKEDLYRAEHNIALGGHYLNELLTQFDGNRILTAAAYNAGPHRVNRWMNSESSETLPYDVWIETIPFKETRSYVQNVLSFSVIYSYRLGQPKKLITELEAKRRL